MSSEEKTVVFNPAGFVLKLIFSVAMTVLLIRIEVGKWSILEIAVMCVFLFLVFYFIASLFGFSLKATGNYIIAAIVFIILVVALSAGMSYLSSLGKVWSAIVTIAAIVGLIWLPIKDIRKAVLYFKNTV